MGGSSLEGYTLYFEAQVDNEAVDPQADRIRQIIEGRVETTMRIGSIFDVDVKISITLVVLVVIAVFLAMALRSLSCFCFYGS